MVPGGRIDMKGTGRQKYQPHKDETALECALSEFTEETQQCIPEDFIQQRITYEPEKDIITDGEYEYKPDIDSY